MSVYNDELLDAALDFANYVRKECGFDPVPYLYCGHVGKSNSCVISRTILNDTPEIQSVSTGGQFTSVTLKSGDLVTSKNFDFPDRPDLNEPDVEWNDNDSLVGEFIENFDNNRWPDLELDDEVEPDTKKLYLPTPATV